MNADFATLLKRAINEKKITNTGLAKKAHISTASLQGYLSGKNNPTLYAAYKISRALDMTLDELYGKRVTKEMLKEIESDKDLFYIVNTFENFSPDKQKLFLQALDKIVENKDFTS